MNELERRLAYHEEQVRNLRNVLGLDDSPLVDGELLVLCKKYHVAVEDVLRRDRRTELVKVRIRIAKELRPHHSISEIARMMKRHHTTIIHMLRKKNTHK